MGLGFLGYRKENFMNKIIDWFIENQKMAIAIGGGIIVFIIASVIIFNIRQSIISQEQAENAENEEQNNTPQIEITEDEQKIIDQYDEDIDEFVAFLVKSVWVNNTETSSLTFTDKSFVENSSNKEKTERVFAVQAVKHVTSNDEEYSIKDSYIASVLVEDKTYIMSVSCYKAKSSDVETNWQLSADFLNDTYNRAFASENIEILEFTDFAKELVGSDYSLIENQITEVCSRQYPTASSATLQKDCDVDLSEKILILSFKLDNGGNSTIKIALDLTNHEITMS